MIPLDDTDRAAYRADLLAQVLAERFPVVPWAESHRKPRPIVEVFRCSEDTPGEIARRVAVLLDEPIQPVVGWAA